MKRLCLAALGTFLALAPFPAGATPVAREIPLVVKTALAVPRSYSFRFSLWDEAAAGVEVWSETASYALTNPTLRHQLGSANLFESPIGYPKVEFSSQLWVLVQVKRKGAYVDLGPRRRLAVAPYALWSSSLPADSVTGVEIADGSITPAKLASGAALAQILDDDGEGSGLDADLLDGQHAAAFALADHTHPVEGGAVSVTSAMIENDAILDEDVSAGAAIADTKLAQIATAGKVADTALPADLDRPSRDLEVSGLRTFRPASGDVPFAVPADRGGTVANLSADLVDGHHAGNAAGDVPVSNGTLSAGLYAERAQSADSAASADSLGGISLAALDVRYAGGAPLAGPVTVDALGMRPSVTIGADGLPIIAYYGDFTLVVAHCTDRSCATGTAFTVLDTASNTLECNVSIAIGADGLPVISYCGAANTLRVAHCGDLACSTGNTLSTVDTGSSSPASTSLAIGADNLPIVAYYGSALGALKTAHCSTAACTSATLATLDPAVSGAGLHPGVSIVIGADGLPVISYYDPAALDLKVAHCGNAACTSGVALATLDAANNVGRDSSIAIGTDGLPVISYLYVTGADLLVAHCVNAACSAGTTFTTVDSVGSVGYGNSLTIGNDGLPFISYYSNADGGLRAMHCGNAGCTSGSAKVTLDAAGSAGAGSTACTIGVDGIPFVAYATAILPTHLKAARAYVRLPGRR